MDLKYLKQIALYVISAIISLLVIAYIGYHIYISFNTNIKTADCTVVTKNETIKLDGYIFRNEKLLSASTSGNVSYLFKDGEKVGAGFEVANVYGSAKDPDVLNEIMKLDEEISILQSSNVSNMTSSDLSNIDSQINDLYYSIRSRTESGDIEYAIRTKNEMLVLLNKRKVIVQAVKSYDSEIAELESKKASLTSSLDSISETVKTTDSGYFYSTVDGYENIFTTDLIDKITLEAFDELIESQPEKVSDLIIGKTVNGFKWYVLCRASQDELRNFTVGSSYSVVFPYSGSAELDMTCEKIDAPAEESDALLVFSTVNLPDNFNYLRMQSVEIIQKNYTGFYVPVSAVRIIDGETGVYVLRGEVVRFRRIDILFEDDGYCIVSETDTGESTDSSYSYLSKNDTLITEGKNLYDGKIIE